MRDVEKPTFCVESSYSWKALSWSTGVVETKGMERFVVDISSDEEDYDRGRTDRLSFDWVDELLDRAVGRRGEEESDDVVVVDEFLLPAVKKRRLNPEPLGLRKCEDEDDDECLVLEVDPDKPVVAAEDKNSGGDEEDDLLVVAEKGQVACRDYPHSRDQCATYPFASSSHKEYCHLCHCYVCDSPAPCSYWGSGNSETDHCHSTDKEERWKSLRKNFKQKNTVTAHPPKSTNDSFKIPTYRDAVPLSHPNLVLLRSSSPQQCSTISNSDLTNIVNQCQPYIVPSRNLQHGQQPMRSFSLNRRLQHVQNEVNLPALNSQPMHSHARSRSLGSMQSGSAVIASHSQNNISHHNRSQRAVQQKSACTTASPQIPYCNQGQLRSEDVLVISPVIPDQMQTALYSERTIAQVESSSLPSITATDIMDKSWEDLLASLASELEDPIICDFGINDGHQSQFVPSPPLHCDNLLYGTDATIATSSAPITNHSPIGFEPNLSNDRMDQTLGHDQGKGPELITVQIPNASQGTSLDSFLASMENGIWS